jgi:hypothetical protein
MDEMKEVNWYTFAIIIIIGFWIITDDITLVLTLLLYIVVVTILVLAYNILVEANDEDYDFTEPMTADERGLCVTI